MAKTIPGADHAGSEDSPDITKRCNESDEDRFSTSYLGLDIADSVVDRSEQLQDAPPGNDEDIDNVDGISDLDAACLNQSFPAGVKTPMMEEVQEIEEDFQKALKALPTPTDGSEGPEEKSSNKEK